MLLTPSELVRKTVELYQKEFWLFLGYTAWILVPIAVFYFAQNLPKNTFTTTLLIMTVILQMFVCLWILICLMRATHLLTLNKPVDPSSLSTQALRRIQPLLCVLLLQILILIGGFLLLIIPSIIFWVWYALAQTATGLDDKPPVEALTFSRSLVIGRFAPVLWRLIAGPLVILLLYLFLSGLIFLVLGTLLGQDLGIIFSDTPPLWVELIQSVIDIFFIPLFLIYSTLLYLDLREHPLEKAIPVT